MVDGNHAGLDFFGEPSDRARVAGPSIGGQAEGQAVGLGDRLVERAETVDKRHRAERFLILDPGGDGHVGQHRGLEEIADVIDPATADAKDGAIFNRLGKKLKNCLERAFVDLLNRFSVVDNRVTQIGRASNARSTWRVVSEG